MSNVLKNGAEIIERFGGIRPMAKKLGVAATTVQGWKKRNAIPISRKSEVLEAANKNGIDIADLIIKNDISSENSNDDINNIDEFVSKSKADDMTDTANDLQSDIMKEIEATKRSAIVGSILMVLFIIGTCGVLIYVMFGANISKVAEQSSDINEIKAEIESLNNDVVQVKQAQIDIISMIPENLQSDFDKIKNVTEELQSSISNLSKMAEELGGDISNLSNMDMDKLFSRISLLEGKVQDIGRLTGSKGLADITERLQDLQKIEGGDLILGSLMKELQTALINNDVNSDDIGKVLEKTATDSEVVAMAFGDVSGEEMKAAALLLAMNQLRDSLNRDKSSFDSDMALVMKLVGNTDNPELVKAVEKLSPHAKEGILTPDGLSKEFRSLAGDVIVSSLSGEDVSVKEKAVSRLNQIIKVEKNGELITGTETEKKVAKAQKLLDEGKVEEAVAILQTLDGQAGQKVKPFIDNAQNTMLAAQVKNLLTGTVMNKLAKMASGSFNNKKSGAKYINR